MVKVYSTPSCPYCVTLKEFLKEKGIQFEDIDVSVDKAELDNMIEKSGQMNVPVVEIGKDVVVGFDKGKIVELLDIKE